LTFILGEGIGCQLFILKGYDLLVIGFLCSDPHSTRNHLRFSSVVGTARIGFL